MAVVTMKQLLEAGVHFGHQTRRWNPKMKRFIFGERNGIYIIDLNQTLVRIEAAYTFVRDLAANGGTILFVGTKKQTQDPIADAAHKCGMPYVNERWLGGMLTNFTTISARVKKMQEYERMKEAGDFEAMPKKEALILSRELEKLQRNLGGIRGLTRMPDAVFIIDTKKEHIAVTEANKLGHADRGRGRHQLRPRPDPVRDPRQRRRHPGRHAHVPGHLRRGRGGQVHRLPQERQQGRGHGHHRRRPPAAPAALDPEAEARRTQQQAEARRQAALQAQEREARLAAPARPRPRPPRPAPAAAEAPRSQPRRRRRGPAPAAEARRRGPRGRRGAPPRPRPSPSPPPTPPTAGTTDDATSVVPGDA